MSQQGAALQTYNNELVRCLDDLRAKRDAIRKEMEAEEADKRRLEEDAARLRMRLDAVNRSLAEKGETRAGYDRAIAECESAYAKIVESSQVLLNVVRKDARALQGQGSNARAKDRAREGS